jgi:type 1 glutamine amidotransferase
VTVRGAALLGLAAALAAAAPATPKKLLVVTVTKGFRHDSIPTAERLAERLAREDGGFAVEFARTDADLARLDTKALDAWDGVFFASTTGDLPLSDRQAFVDWIGRGHGFVGIHSASDTFHGFPPFVAMLGGEFDTHGEQATVTLLVRDKDHPATRGLADGLTVLDEIYLFKSFDPARVHLLLSLDRHPNTGAPGSFPLAWTREQGTGRVFYTALGHREDVLESPWYAQHLRGGIRWALGLEQPAR